MTSNPAFSIQMMLCLLSDTHEKTKKITTILYFNNLILHLSYVRKIHHPLNTILCTYVMCTKYTSSDTPDVKSNSKRKLKIIKKIQIAKANNSKIMCSLQQATDNLQKHISTAAN